MKALCLFVVVQQLSRVLLFATPWTVACQAFLFMGFSRRQYWSGLPFPSPGDLPNLGTEPRSPALQEDALPSEPPGKSCHTQRSTKTINHNVCSSQTGGTFYQDVCLTECSPLIKLTYNGLPHYLFGTVLKAR